MSWSNLEYPSNFQVAKAFYRTLSSVKLGLFIYVLALLGVKISHMTELYFSGSLVDAFASQDRMTAITSYMTLNYLVQTIANMLEYYLNITLEKDILAKLRGETFVRVLNRDISFFDSQLVGKITSKLNKDCDEVPQKLMYSLYDLVDTVFGTIFTLYYLCNLSFKLTLAVAVPLPIIGIGLFVQSRWEDFNNKELSKSVDELNHQAIEALSQSLIYHQLTHQLLQVSNRVALWSSFQSMLFFMGFNGSVVIAFWFGSSLVASGQITIGQLVNFSLFATQLSDKITTFPLLVTRVGKMLHSLKRIYAIQGHVTETPKLLVKPEVGKQLDMVKGEIAFEDVSFAYPTRPDQMVLKNFSFIVRQGEKLGIVGPSGSGKSTIVLLLLKFYRPLTGVITLDGVDIQTLDTLWLRQNIGWINQEALFSGTVAENIAYGLPTPESEEDTRDKVMRAAKEANAHTFITALEKGYDAEVGEKGSLLSAGQKQRIVIARALVRNPRFLLSDEATSALDNQTEAVIQETLDRVTARVTSIVIAHRLRTLEKSTRILVMQHGVLIQSGTHLELMDDKDGLYFTLASHPEDVKVSDEVVSEASDSSSDSDSSSE